MPSHPGPLADIVNDHDDDDNGIVGKKDERDRTGRE